MFKLFAELGTSKKLGIILSIIVVFVLTGVMAWGVNEKQKKTEEFVERTTKIDFTKLLEAELVSVDTYLSTQKGKVATDYKTVNVEVRYQEQFGDKYLVFPNMDNIEVFIWSDKQEFNDPINGHKIIYTGIALVPNS